MQFEQIKAITEKYGPVMEQLDRLQEGHKLGSADYFHCLEKMKLAVSDQFMFEVKKLQDRPSDEQKELVANREE